MPDRLARSLVDLAMELHRRRLWTKSPPDAPFLIRVPKEDWPLVATLIGQAKSDYGVMILRGEHAFGALVSSFDEDSSGSGLANLADILGVSFEPLGAIPAELRPLLSEAGFKARRENIAPHLMVKRLGRLARAPNRSEMRTMAWCLQAILAADDAGALRPQEPDRKRKRVLELAVSGELKHPALKTRMVPWPEGGPPLPDQLGLDPGLARLRVIDERWIFCVARVPGAIHGDDRSLQVALVVDQATERILGNEMVLGEELEPCAALIEKVMLERGGIPGEIVFTTSTVHDSLSPALCALGVRSTIGEAPAFVDELVASLREHLGGRRARQALPETIEEWKKVDQEVSARLHDAVQENLLTPVAMRRYFGSVELGKRVLAELQSLSPLLAFIEWAVSDYRPPMHPKTLVETLLREEDLVPAERVLLEARRSAQLSIYRVDACEPGATLDVEDILSGERLIVNDSALSGCGLEGFFLPLRIMRVGGWIFPCLGGPPLSASNVDRFLQRFDDIGARLGKKGLRSDADLVGWMWGWMLEAQEEEPKLTNTDGDALELQTAVFQVADRAAVTSAIGARDDLSAGPDGTWSWLRPGGPAPGFGDNTVLAELELHDDRLVVEVNSAARLQRAREWLEGIPGVRFERASRADLERRPVDDRLPSKPPPPLSPAMRKEATRHFHRTCRAWLDERVPSLGNKTPRAACKTAAGRRRVARMIRSMPAMHAPGGSIAPPRKEMLRELGIQQ